MKRLISIILAVGVVGLLVGAVSFNNPTPGQLVVFHDANTFTNAANGVFNGITNYGVIVNTPQLSTVGTAIITGTNYWYVQTSSNITLTLSGTAVEGQFVTFDVSNSAVTNISVALSPSVWEPASSLLVGSISVTATNEEALHFTYRGGRWKMFHDGFQHTLAAGNQISLSTNASVISINVGEKITNNVELVAADSVLTFDGGNNGLDKVFIQTNRMTAASTLVVTNFIIGQIGTAIVPGEASGGTDRNIVVAVAAGDLIRLNGAAPVASLTIVATNGIEWELNFLKKSFRSTNYWDLRASFNVQ